jgi:anti-sigma B factor antagonist
MELQSHELDSGILSISLTGRFDTLGAQEIDLKFTALSATRKVPVLVDLSGVTFLASIGIRTLVVNAKAQRNRGGAMVLYQPTNLVEEVLKSAGIDTIIPIAHDMEGARKALTVT